MASMTDYAQRRLSAAQRGAFNAPVTAFITDAQLVACCCFGVTHAHLKANTSGRFQDGHRIRTSDVIKVEYSGGYWNVHTESGSHYVIATFNRRGGRQSLDTFLAFQKRGVHATAARFH
ncbi:MAG: hypothetical protein WA173_18710 [Pseudomonas sp.]|uniref:hypothetical protein n=1 Tax=Pseudomonas sp. TaxID=306 RepID=UPI003BB70A06